jgi:hypothetical protein
MPGIYSIRLTDATVRIGPQFERLDGFADDKFTLAPFTDVGAFMSGIDGDTLHVMRASNGWLFTITALQASAAVERLNFYHETLGVFPIAVSFGNFNLNGVMNMISLGEVAASLGTTTRTLTGGVSKIAGNTTAAPGTIVQVL